MFTTYFSAPIKWNTILFVKKLKSCTTHLISPEWLLGWCGILGVAGFLPFEQKGIRQSCFLCFLTNAQLLIDVMHSLKLKLPPLRGLLCCWRHPVKLVNKSFATGLCLMSCLQFCWLCLLLSGFLSRLVSERLAVKSWFFKSFIQSPNQFPILLMLI